MSSCNTWLFGKAIFKSSHFFKQCAAKYVLIFNAIQLQHVTALHTVCPVSNEYIFNHSIKTVCDQCDVAVFVSGELVNAFATWLRLRCVLSYAKYRQQTSKIIFIYQTETVNSGQFKLLQILWNVNQTLQDWPYIISTYEIQHAYWN